MLEESSLSSSVFLNPLPPRPVYVNANVVCDNVWEINGLLHVTCQQILPASETFTMSRRSSRRK